MCGCGRRRAAAAEAVTSAQTAAARTGESDQLVNTLADQTVAGAEALLRSAGNAARNASS